VLVELGFLVEHFGGSTFMVRGLPAVLGPISPRAALEAVVDDLELGKRPMGETLEERIVGRVCKTAAVKAGHVLTMEEMSAMVRQLERCETPQTCPHGRPTMITLSAAQMARQFGRT
jgi:DNA mismatch repair protein MutL